MAQEEIQKATELLRQAEKENIDRCAAEIEQVLMRYNCVIVPQITIRGTEIIPRLAIVPNQGGQPMFRADNGKVSE